MALSRLLENYDRQTDRPTGPLTNRATDELPPPNSNNSIYLSIYSLHFSYQKEICGVKKTTMPISD